MMSTFREVPCRVRYHAFLPPFPAPMAPLISGEQAQVGSSVLAVDRPRIPEAAAFSLNPGQPMMIRRGFRMDKEIP